MAIEAWVKRTQMGHLVPANSQSAEALKALPVDEWRMVSIRAPRNVKHHRKWFALLQAVFAHQTMWPTLDLFNDKVKEALGYGEYVIDGLGNRHFRPESIGFHNMDQHAFEQFYERGVDLIVNRILPGVGRDDLEREVHDILKGRKAA